MSVLKMKPTLNGEGGQGGGSALYTYYIKAEDVDGNNYNYNCTIQCESSDINSYDTLAEYLIEKVFILKEKTHIILI